MSAASRKKKIVRAKQQARRQDALAKLGVGLTALGLWSRAEGVVKMARGGGWRVVGSRFIPNQKNIETSHSSTTPWRRTGSGWKLNADWEHLRQHLPNYNLRAGWTRDERRLHDYIVAHDLVWPSTPKMPEEVLAENRTLTSV